MVVHRISSTEVLKNSVQFGEDSKDIPKATLNSITFYPYSIHSSHAQEIGWQPNYLVQAWWGSISSLSVMLAFGRDIEKDTKCATSSPTISQCSFLAFALKP